MKNAKKLPHEFEFVPKHSSEVKQAYQELQELLRRLHDELRSEYTFQHTMTGSYQYNMMTRDKKGNQGFDFDVDIWPSEEAMERLSAKQIRTTFQRAFDRLGICYGYSPAEDSTRVLTIKIKDQRLSRIVRSVDIAFMRLWEDDERNERKAYIHFYKGQNSYAWQEQEKSDAEWEEKIKWLTENGLWNGVREKYLALKNKNQNENKKSRSLLKEAVNDCCNEFGYWEDEQEQDGSTPARREACGEWKDTEVPIISNLITGREADRWTGCTIFSDRYGGWKW